MAEERNWLSRAADVVLGRRLANREAEARRIGAFEGVPAMGLDALGSTAYGPEAALVMLMPLGAAGLHYIGWVTAPVVALLAILYFSYRQTIRAYPSSGGAYVVAKENLGTNASLLAAAALMIDYVLNVAVGISAGVGALISAIPELQPHTLPSCLVILAVITLANLRGTLDSGRLFAAPVYLFILCFAAIFISGLIQIARAHGQPIPLVGPPPAMAGTEAVSAWLLVRAIAAGCTAMTGVEAVSNGVGAFRDPKVRYGHRTLTVICAVLGVMLVCIAALVPAYRVAAMDQEQPGYQSVLSQIAGAVAGHGALYYTALTTLLCVLALSANTSFVGFPRLCRQIACDGFLPRAFAQAGRRLVFSSGILYLAGFAALLLVMFGGVTNRLIPLFAIGAFASFTISQAAMVAHWRREKGHRLALAINLLGAWTTGLALVVIVVAKFSEGAWITLLVVPAIFALLARIKRYYDRLDARTASFAPLDVRAIAQPVVIVMLDELDRTGLKGISLGMSLSSDVLAVHLTQLEGPDAGEDALRSRWHELVDAPVTASGRVAPRLMVLPSQRRTLIEPLLRLLDRVKSEFPERPVAVLIPEHVKRRWYHPVLHTYRARRLRQRLLAVADPRLTIVTVPWRLD